jgi:hypothetical protein
MALLKRWRVAPPGNWTYFQKESQLRIKAENGDALVDQVVEHRKYRGFTPTDRETVKLEVQRQICEKLGFNDCRPEGESDPWKPKDGSKPLVTMSNVLSFSKAAIAFVKSGGELAPMEEVKRRADICRQCFWNRELSGCACGGFYKILDAAIPKDRKLDGLHVCGICNCSNGVKVNLTEEQVRASNAGRNLPWPTETPCWQFDVMQKQP